MYIVYFIPLIIGGLLFFAGSAFFTVLFVFRRWKWDPPVSFGIKLALFAGVIAFLVALKMAVGRHGGIVLISYFLVSATLYIGEVIRTSHRKRYSRKTGPHDEAPPQPGI